jgi:hypothetical protein
LPINQTQAAPSCTQQQISTGDAWLLRPMTHRRQILETSQAQSVNQQYMTNQDTAKNLLTD